MLILIDKPGQLCNRLWAFTPFINDGLKNNYKITILHFYDYYEYFEDLNIYKNIRFLKSGKSFFYYKLLFKLLNKFPKGILKKIGVFYDPEICVTKINFKRNIAFVEAWKSEKDCSTQLDRDKISKLFQPKDIFVQKVDEIFKKKRESFDLIIGVHIRKGDYKDYKNGAYFYTDLTYMDFIDQLTNEFGTTKKLGFFLCSNEEINHLVFEKFSVFQIIDTHPMEDLYGLSKCDYIIGPPSTYSMWASFYGQKPLLFIKKDNCELKAKDFSIIDSRNRFRNGNIFNH